VTKLVEARYHHLATIPLPRDALAIVWWSAIGASACVAMIVMAVAQGSGEGDKREGRYVDLICQVHSQ
jgi:hypothetical protein